MNIESHCEMVYLMDKRTNRMTISLTDAQRSALDALAERTPLKVADLIYIAIDGLLDYAKVHGGKLVLPLDFSTFFTQADTLLRAAEDPHPYTTKSDDPPSCGGTCGEDTPRNRLT